MQTEKRFNPEILQINPETGLDFGYRNEIMPSVVAFLTPQNIQDVIKTIRRWPIKKYTERIPPESCREENEQQISRLDDLADRLNSEVAVGSLTKEVFIAISNEIEDIVAGSKAKHISL